MHQPPYIADATLVESGDQLGHSLDGRRPGVVAVVHCSLLAAEDLAHGTIQERLRRYRKAQRDGALGQILLAPIEPAPQILTTR
jgi:hypothetical protein